MRRKNLLLILATGLIFGVFSAAAGAVPLGDTADFDPFVEQTIPNGYTYTKENIRMIRNVGDDNEFVMNVLPAGTSVEEPITIIVTKAKTMRAGSQVIRAEIHRSYGRYASSVNEGNPNNNVIVFNVSNISTGRVEYLIPVESAAEGLGDLADGTRVYVYAFDEKNNSVTDETRYVQGRVRDGKITFTENPAQLAREDGEVFLISARKLH